MNGVLFENEQRAVLLLFTLVFLGLYVFLAFHKKNMVGRTFLPKNRPRGFFETNWLAFYAKALCFVVSWALLSIAFMGPQSKDFAEKISTTRVKNVDEIIFLLDASASMRALDSSLGTSRFDRAKEIIHAVVENLGGSSIALVAFSGNEDVLVPPTADYFYFRILLDSARINEPGTTGTNFISLIDALQKELTAATFSKKTLFVLLSDGEDTASEKSQKLFLEKLADVSFQSTNWDVVALGSVQGSVVPDVLDNGSKVISKMDLPFLQAVAKQGKGKLYEENASSLLSIVDNIGADAMVEQMSTSKSETGSSKEAIIPLVASLLFVLIGLFLPMGKK